MKINLQKYPALVIFLNCPVWAFSAYLIFIGTSMAGLVLGGTAILNCAAALKKPAVVKAPEAMLICLMMAIGNLFFLYVGATLMFADLGDRETLPGAWMIAAGALGFWDVYGYKDRVKQA